MVNLVIEAAAQPGTNGAEQAGPGSAVLIGALAILAGVLALRFRARLWGIVSERTRKVSRPKLSRFMYVSSYLVVPVLVVAWGVAVLINGVARL